MSKDTETTEKLEELDWVDFQTMSDARTETFWRRTKRKCKENPFVPIGVIATTSALSYGLYSFQQGNAWMSQYMMRARILSQAFTIGSVAIGYYLYSKPGVQELNAEMSK